MHIRSRQRGLTLVELMTTVGVATISLSLGVPAFSSVQASMQRTQASMELISSFSLARSEAARRGVSVTVCPSSNGTSCATGTSPNWGSGWIVFTDLNDNSAVDSATDEIVHTVRFANTAFSLTSQTEIGKGVRFAGSGFPSATGRYTYCDKTSSRQLDLTFVGRLEQVGSGQGCL